MSTFRIQEFARLAGVTVRALHHYDRLGLLTPAHRSESGYRLYEHDDLTRLERVLVLRFLGLSLREITDLLRGPHSLPAEPLPATLRAQRAVLRERRNGLDRVLQVVERVEAKAANSAEPDWLLYQTILKEIQMQEARSWTERYYGAEGLTALRERRAALTSEAQAEIGAKWHALFNDIQETLDRSINPDSDEGRAIVARWMRLVDEFTLGHPELNQGLGRLYSDENHWPNDEEAAKLRSRMPKPEHHAFFRAAMSACLRHG